MGIKRTMNRLPIILLFLLVFVANQSFALTAQEKEAGFVSLFDGSDLDQWKITGNKEAFGIEDGALTCYGKGGDRIQTLKKYENFILRFTFKISKNGNNGVYIHCPDHGRESRVGGEIQIRDTHGHKPTPSTCGALYDVFAPREDANKPHTEWQTMEIKFIWPQIQVTMNDTLILDRDVTTHDRSKYRTRYGYIAFQDHSDRVWYKDVRIKDLGGNTEEQWIPILHEDDLDNWYQIGELDYEIKNGVLTLGKGLGYIINKSRYENFQLWTYVNTDSGTENGIYYRWKGTANKGHRVTIANDKGIDEYTGSLTDLVEANRRHVGNNGWNPLQIFVEGKETVTVVNGRVAARYKKTELGKGNIAIDMPDSRGKIKFKDMRILPF